MTILLLISVVASAGEVQAPSAVDHQDSASGLECGLETLLLYSHAIGNPKTIDDFRIALDALPTESGYTMLQLQEAAAKVGIRLRGVRLAAGLSKLRTPAIVLCRLGEHFHYRLLRPTGHSGRLVMALDPSFEEPFAMDLEIAQRSKEWTGFALIPSNHSHEFRTVVVWLLVIATAGVVLLYSAPRFRSLLPTAAMRHCRWNPPTKPDDTRHAGN